MVTGITTALLLDFEHIPISEGPVFQLALGAHRLRGDWEILGFAAGMNRKLEEQAGQTGHVRPQKQEQASICEVCGGGGGIKRKC